MKITFTGDISITGSFTEKVSNDLEIFSKGIRDFLSTSDFTIGNLEGPTTNKTKVYNFNTPLKSPINSIRYLKSRNITTFNLSNNHILDYGQKGLEETLLEIKKEDCDYFGAGLTQKKTIKPVVLKKGDISLAIFGITRCIPTQVDNAKLFSSNDFELLKQQIKFYRAKVDFIFVNFHGGEEFSLYPSPVKRRLLKKIAKIRGVKCIIAHHSHTFQGYEFYRKKPIFYSLGNFIFDILNHKTYPKTDESALLQFHFTKTDFSFSFLPLKIENGRIVNSNLSDFRKTLKSLNDFSNYKKKWQKEAHRILFRKENLLIDKQIEEKDSLQEKSFFAIFFSKKFYSKVYLILRDKYLFSLYTNAVFFKIKSKYRL